MPEQKRKNTFEETVVVFRKKRTELLPRVILQIRSSKEQKQSKRVFKHVFIFLQKRKMRKKEKAFK